MPRYSGSQSKRKAAKQQLGLHEQTGGSKLAKTRDTMQIGSGRAYDPVKRAEVRTKNEEFVRAMSSEQAEARFRDRAHIKRMRESAEAFRKTAAASETPEQYAKRMKRRSVR